MVNYFNKKLLFDNMMFLLKEQSKKIGELESEAGVSIGYISRTNKDGKAKPGIDFIMKAADYLNVSLDTLLTVDLTELTPTERYLVSFFEKLIMDTGNDKLDWKTETADYLNYRLETDRNGYCKHPLFSEETFYEKGEGEYPEEINKTVFTSNSYGTHTIIEGDCFNLQMKNGAVLYVMKICKSPYRNDNSQAIELWMCPRQGEKQFLCGTKDNAELQSLIHSLYQAIAENTKHPKVKKEIRTVIDAFMNDDMGEDDEDTTAPLE